MRTLAGRLDLSSINTATLGYQAPIGVTIDAVAGAGYGAICPWRREIEGGDVGAIARHIRDAGLKVSGYCRSTYIPALTRPEFLANIADNRRAIDQAAVTIAHHAARFTRQLEGGRRVQGLPARTHVLAVPVEIGEAIAVTVDEPRRRRIDLRDAARIAAGDETSRAVAELGVGG